MSNHATNTHQLINHINYFISPSHYIKDEQNNYVVIKKGINIRFIDYVIARISLLFFQIIHFVYTLGYWENDRSLWRQLNEHIFHIQLESREPLSGDDLKALTQVYNNLTARFEGKITHYALSKINLNTDLKNENLKLEKNLQSAEKLLKFQMQELDRLKTEKETIQKKLTETTEIKELSEQSYESTNDKARMLLNQIEFIEKQILELSKNGSKVIDLEKNTDFTPLSWSMATYIQNLDLSIADHATIVFKDDIIQVANTSSQETEADTVEEFKQIFLENYGKYLTELVWSRYEFDKLQKVTMGDIKKAVISVAANVRKLDLECLFDEMKRHNNGMISYRCGDYLKSMDPIKFSTIQKKKRFEELTQDEIYFMLSAFRTSIHKSSPSDALSILYNDQGLLKDNLKKLTPKCFINDIELLESFGWWNKLELEADSNKLLSKEERYRAALTEYLGKTLAYYDLKPGMVFIVPSMDQTPISYIVQDFVNYQGVVSYFLTPLIKSTSNQSEETFLIFRGTVTQRQVARDMHFEGIGKPEFEQSSADLMKMVIDYAAQSKNRLKLNICGHSLGACDTQRALVQFLEDFIKSDSNDPLIKYENVSITTHNSPRPESKLNLRLKKAVQALINDKEKKISIDILHILFCDLLGPDQVQEMGDILLGANKDNNQLNIGNKFTNKIFKNADFLKIKVVELQIQMEYRLKDWVKRHSFRAFNKILRNGINWLVKRAYDTSQRNDLDKVLAKNHHWDEKENGYSKHFNWYLNGFKKSPFTLLHWILDKSLKPYLAKE